MNDSDEITSFVCRVCDGIFHAEEACDLPDTVFACDVCRKSFEASQICWSCYFLPHPLRCCAECIKDEYDDQEPQPARVLQFPTKKNETRNEK